MIDDEQHQTLHPHLSSALTLPSLVLPPPLSLPSVIFYFLPSPTLTSLSLSSFFHSISSSSFPSTSPYSYSPSFPHTHKSSKSLAIQHYPHFPSPHSHPFLLYPSFPSSTPHTPPFSTLPSLTLFPTPHSLPFLPCTSFPSPSPHLRFFSSLTFPLCLQALSLSSPSPSFLSLFLYSSSPLTIQHSSFSPSFFFLFSLYVPHFFHSPSSPLSFPHFPLSCNVILPIYCSLIHFFQSLLFNFLVFFSIFLSLFS